MDSAIGVVRQSAGIRIDRKFNEVPAAVPEILVSNIDKAAEYYRNPVGFTLDWGDEAGGVAGISKGDCRMFLANTAFREMHGNSVPVVIWLNLNSKQEVDDLHADWERSHAKIVSPPEDKPWKLREFTASDLDGNLFRVFHDFHGDV